MTNEELILEAKKAREHAYTPHSHFQVGAALVTKSGKIYHGCNIENAAYTPTNCAERTAVFQAVAQGMRKFRAIAISGGMEGRQPEDYAYPCGICRQVLQEFAEENFKVIVAKNVEDFQEYDLKELLPLGFGGGSIR